MNKVGILTYHNAINYGAVFQTYALQQFLTNLGYETYIIDYKNKSVENQYRLKQLRLNKLFLTNLKWDIQQIAYLPEKKKNFKMWQKNFNLLAVKDKEHLYESTKNLDKVIVGSDQVWKIKAHDFDSSYFLDFVNKDKRISYAASFGSSVLEDEEKVFLSKYLKEIPCISVREESGTKLVKELTGKNAELVLDPVLLIDSGFWKSKINTLSNKQGEYVFVYQLGSGDYLPFLSRKIADELGIKVVFVADNLRTILSYGFSSINKSSVGPEDFLNLLYNAKVVCTNSFHATALSLVMHKDFYTVIKGSESDLWNTRIYGLLNRFNQSDRIIHSGDSLSYFSPCDFETFDQTINDFRVSSEMFLKRSIAGK